jgi:hypothetical protein
VTEAIETMPPTAEGARGQAPRPSLPAAPTLGGALRAAGVDLFYNSWRVVPANVVVAVWLLAVLATVVLVGPVVGALVAIPVALPLAGLFRLGALATRGQDVNLSDVLDPAREAPGPVVIAGSLFAVVTLVLATNVVIGLAAGALISWAVATLALWGLLATFAFGFAFWPLAVDPRRAGVPWRERARLAGLLVLAHPVRLGALTVVLTLLLVVSTIAVAALVTVSVGFVALAACRYVLPAADRLEARLAGEG